MENKTLLCKIPIYEFGRNGKLSNAWKNSINGKITEKEFNEAVKEYMKSNYDKLNKRNDNAIHKFLYGV